MQHSETRVASAEKRELKAEGAKEKGEWYKGAEKLKDKVALITGGSHGIGRSVAVFFAKEGCDVAISYRASKEDAELTKKWVEEAGRRCLLLQGDIRDKAVCRSLVEKTVAAFGKLNILVNNAAVQHWHEKFEELTPDIVADTFDNNVVSHFEVTRAALEHLQKHEDSTIINTTSVVAFRGMANLADYAATKGANLAFTRSMAKLLASQKGQVRVNCVAPGPIWTPLIPRTMPKEKVESFGQDTPLGRAGQSEEVAPAFVFLASRDSSYITGQTIHINGGEIVA